MSHIFGPDSYKWLIFINIYLKITILKTLFFGHDEWALIKNTTIVVIECNFLWYYHYHRNVSSMENGMSKSLFKDNNSQIYIINKYYIYKFILYINILK